MAIGEKAIEKAVELVKPMYEDALQPAAQELGQGLKAALSILMAPWKILGTASDAHLQAFKEGYEKKIANIPDDRLVAPDLQLAGSALNALAYTVQEEALREMFEKLLATASDSETSGKAHPAYVEVIKQLSPAEAVRLGKILENQSLPIGRLLKKGEGRGHSIISRLLLDVKSQESIDFLEKSVDNWIRLGLLEIDFQSVISENGAYDGILSFVRENYADCDIMSIFTIVSSSGDTYLGNKKKPAEYSIIPGVLEVTSFGRHFFESCIA